MRSCSYTRKNVHRKKKQGQEVSCIQNGMGVGGEPYIAYDPILGAWSTFGLTDVELLTPFALTYCVYVPRVKASTALLEWPF